MSAGLAANGRSELVSVAAVEQADRYEGDPWELPVGRKTPRVHPSVTLASLPGCENRRRGARYGGSFIAAATLKIKHCLLVGFDPTQSKLSGAKCFRRNFNFRDRSRGWNSPKSSATRLLI
jgi:hypothetical protein